MKRCKYFPRVALAIGFVTLGLGVSIRQVEAESPFLIEDPSTIRSGRLESFTGYERYVSSQAGTTSVPSLELHSGLRDNLLLHVDLPYQQITGTDARATGLGDFGFGLKYRFLHGRGEGVIAAFFPHMTIPTGSSSKGLGSGKPTYEFPLWAQRTTGPLTICLGGGISVNPVSGGRTSSFVGILVHRDLGERWMAGAEILAKGAETSDDRATTTVNLGATYHLTPNTGFLARVGRTVAGLRTDNVYLGLYRAMGRPAEVEK